MLVNNVRGRKTIKFRRVCNLHDFLSFCKSALVLQYQPVPNKSNSTFFLISFCCCFCLFFCSFWMCAFVYTQLSYVSRGAAAQQHTVYRAVKTKYTVLEVWCVFVYVLFMGTLKSLKA